MGCGATRENTRNVKLPEAKPPPEPAIRPRQEINTRPHVEDEQVMFDEDIDRELKAAAISRKGKSISKMPTHANEEVKVGLFDVEEVGVGDQMLAIKPWLGALRAPTNPPRVNNNPPNVRMELEYVYGYRCFDSRRNLFYTRTREIVYMTAAVGVVLNKQTNTQKLFGGGPANQEFGHTDDITSLAIHPDKDIIATGEVGKDPKICIWKSSDPRTSISEFRQGRDSRAVGALGFSFDGKVLASADLHNDHNVRIWNWEKGTLIGQDKGGPDRILDLCWSPRDLSFCTCGIKHMAFWTYNPNAAGVQLRKEKGIFGSVEAMCNMTCVQYMPDNTCVTGATNGQLYHWAGKNLKKAYQIHPQGQTVHSLAIVDEKIFSGAKDNTIRILDLSFTEIGRIETSSFARAIDVYQNTVLAGTRDGTIAEYQAGMNRRTVLMESHSDGEVWGLALSPTNVNIVVTVGDDNAIKVWNMAQRKCVKTSILEENPGPQRRPGEGASTLATNSPNQQARGVCINSGNGHVAVGHNDGHISIFQNIDNLRRIHIAKDPKEWIEAMAYSPDSSKLAVGSHDNFIYIYNVENNYKLLHKLKGHSSFIIALDWSVDGSALHTNCGAYELLFWDANSGQQVKSGGTAYRDEEWAAWTAKLGWHVQGIYEGVVDMTHVNCVDRSQNKRFFAVGNDWGNVVLFNNPNGEGAKGASFKGHSEHVTNVKWSSNDEYLFSTGGYDQTVMQWKILN